MTDPRRPDHSIVDDDVEGHATTAGRVQPPRDEADVEGHGFSVRPATRDDAADRTDDSDDDVQGHVYVRPEDQSREG